MYQEDFLNKFQGRTEKIGKNGIIDIMKSAHININRNKANYDIENEDLKEDSLGINNSPTLKFKKIKILKNTYDYRKSEAVKSNKHRRIGLPYPLLSTKESHFISCGDTSKGKNTPILNIDKKINNIDSIYCLKKKIKLSNLENRLRPLSKSVNAKLTGNTFSHKCISPDMTLSQKNLDKKEENLMNSNNKNLNTNNIKDIEDSIANKENTKIQINKYKKLVITNNNITSLKTSLNKKLSETPVFLKSIRKKFKITKSNNTENIENLKSKEHKNILINNDNENKIITTSQKLLLPKIKIPKIRKNSVLIKNKRKSNKILFNIDNNIRNDFNMITNMKNKTKKLFDVYKSEQKNLLLNYKKQNTNNKNEGKNFLKTMNPLNSSDYNLKNLLDMIQEEDDNENKILTSQKICTRTNKNNNYYNYSNDCDNFVDLNFNREESYLQKLILQRSKYPDLIPDTSLFKLPTKKNLNL